MVDKTTTVSAPPMATVTLYTTGSACMQCQMTQRVLDARGITFEEIDLTDPANAGHLEHVTNDLGHTQAPIVIVDGQPENHWSGFRPDLIERLASSAGPRP